jgi:hypothetical protein
MAAEYLDADWHGLFRLARLVDDYWWLGDSKLLAEIRQAQAPFGLTPVDRSRLHWEVARGEQATNQRRSTTPAAKAATKKVDPRLRLVQGG